MSTIELQPIELQPVVRQIEQWNMVLINRCNLHCVTCSYPDQLPIKMIRRSTIQRLLPRMLEYGTQRAMLTGGEPTMHPEFDAIVQDLHEAGLALTLVTNGTYLSHHFEKVRGRLARCIISLDGDTPELYREIRGADAFRHLVQLPARFRQESSGTHVTFCIVVQRRNFRRLAAFMELGIRCGVDRVSFLAPDLLGMVNPDERPGAFGHLKAVPKERIDSIALTLDEVEEFRTEIIPAVRKVTEQNPSYHNNTVDLLPEFANYFTAFRKEVPRQERRLCALPFREVVLDENENLRFCFFMPDRWPAADQDPVNHPGIVSARNDYLTSNRRLDRFCNMCLQAMRVNSEAPEES